MNYRRLGRSGLRVSVMALGTMNMGTQLDAAESRVILDAAVAGGINFIDTAEMYPSPMSGETQGRSEEIVGEWLAGRPRDSIVLATKICGANRADNGDIVPHIRQGWAALDWHHFERACEASLRRLKTDYIDLYQTHWPDRGVAVEAQLEAFERLIEAGKVRYAGVSNESSWGLMRLLAEAERGGLPRIVSLQNQYSLVHRDYDHGLAEICEREGVGMLPFSPLGQGVLTGKYAGGKIPANSRFDTNETGRARFGTPEMIARAERYVGVARANGLDPAAMAYAWVRERRGVASVITSCSKTSQVDVVVKAADMQLSPDILTALAAA